MQRGNITLIRGDLEIEIGYGGDMSWADVDAIKLQLELQRAHLGAERVPEQLDQAMLGAVVRVMRQFGGSHIARWEVPDAPRARRRGATGREPYARSYYNGGRRRTASKSRRRAPR